MTKYINELSRTFSEYLLLPGLTTKQCLPENTDLRSPMAKFNYGQSSRLELRIPFVSAIMQAVSGSTLAIALARRGGLSFLYGSQSIEDQVAMIRRVKGHKAGFVVSDANVTPSQTIAEALEMVQEKGHSTLAVTDDGSPNGTMLGLLTERDYRLSRIDLDSPVSDHMVPTSDLAVARKGTSIQTANDMIWEQKIDCLPIVDSQGKLWALVFRKDYNDHKENPEELLDAQKRLVVGAGVNTHDYKTRIPALVEAGVDVLCVDSSDGYSEWQADTLNFVRDTFGDQIIVGGGNVVHAEAFQYLVNAGADFVKVGIGGGAICITREQKGIGRGQASSLIEVVRARDDYFNRTGTYIPICSDGGISHDYHIGLALAMGADFVMMGRFFARFDESPGKIRSVEGRPVKEYWGEGTRRASNWERYREGSGPTLLFEEGSDEYVPYAGPMHDNLQVTIAKIRSMMANVGATSLPELRELATFVLVSGSSVREGGIHDVILKRMQLE